MTKLDQLAKQLRAALVAYDDAGRKYHKAKLAQEKARKELEETARSVEKARAAVALEAEGRTPNYALYASA